MTDYQVEIPAEVLQFIEQAVDSIPHLEALLMMWESAPKTWTAAEIAARIYVDRGTSRKILRDLVRRQLIVRQSADRSTYAYDSSNQSSAALLPLVARAYGSHLVVITRLVHSKASLAVQEFSRAFRFKRDP